MGDTSTICMGDSYERMSPLWYNTHSHAINSRNQLTHSLAINSFNQLIKKQNKNKNKNKNKFNPIMCPPAQCSIQCPCGGSYSGTKFLEFEPDSDILRSGHYAPSPSQIQRHFNTKKHIKWIQENQQLCCEGEVYIGEGVYVEDEEEEEHYEEEEEARCVCCFVEIDQDNYYRDEYQNHDNMCQSCGEDEEAGIAGVVVTEQEDSDEEEIEVEEVQTEDGLCTYYYDSKNNRFYNPVTEEKIEDTGSWRVLYDIEGRVGLPVIVK